jgi:UDP-N-acetylmuramoyl-tripeptide--D-alanyl-D-alanine ligase
MCLLGSKSGEYHYKIGNRIAGLGINRLVVIGDDAYEIGYGAIKAGMKREDIFLCKDPAETLRVLKKLLDEDSILLVKTTMKASYSELMNGLLIQK